MGVINPTELIQKQRPRAYKIYKIKDHEKETKKKDDHLV